MRDSPDTSLYVCNLCNPKVGQDMANHKTATARKREKFLNVLKESGNVSVAVKRAAISRRIAYVWRGDDPVFAVEWEDAMQEYCDTLEAEADRRAVEGVPSRLYFDKEGNQIGEIRRYSDTLLIQRLKALKPEIYREPPSGIDPKVINLFLQQVLIHVDDNAKQKLLSWIEGQWGLGPFRNN